MKSVSIIAATFYGNRGAECMLSTTIGKLRESCDEGLNFNVYSYYPEQDKRIVDDASISIYSSTPLYLITVLAPCSILHRLAGILHLRFIQSLLPRSVRALASSDVYICLAGVSFVAGREKFLPFNIATIFPAMVLSVPVVKFAQAMGGFGSLINRWAAKLFLSRCKQVFTRGKTTDSHLCSILSGVANFQRADDVAFLFESKFCISKPADGVNEKISRLLKLRKGARTVVGVCPSSVVSVNVDKAGGDYIGRMTELIEMLVNNGHIVALYPNATRDENMAKLHNNDLPVLSAIMSGIHDADHVVCFDDAMNVGQICEVIGLCDVNAVSRFHAMVASLVLDVPVMVIGWSHKYLEVMERFNQQDMVLDYKDGNIDVVSDCIEQLISEKHERALCIAEALPDVKSLSNRQVQYVVNILKASP